MVIRYITPLRLAAVLLVVLAIFESVKTSRLVSEGYEPGLGGIFYIYLLILAASSVGLDIALTYFLRNRMGINWILQIMIMVSLLLWVLSL